MSTTKSQVKLEKEKSNSQESGGLKKWLTTKSPKSVFTKVKGILMPEEVPEFVVVKCPVPTGYLDGGVYQDAFITAIANKAREYITLMDEHGIDGEIIIPEFDEEIPKFLMKIRFKSLRDYSFFELATNLYEPLCDIQFTDKRVHDGPVTAKFTY